VLGSWCGRIWADNSRALYEYIQANPCGFEAYYYQRELGGNCDERRCVYGIRWRTAWILLRARVAICTHYDTSDFSLYRFSRRKLIIQTWHGVPIKAICFTRKNAPKATWADASKNIRRFDVLIAPSKLAAWAMCSCWMFDPRKIFLCGQARNDNLLRQDADISALKTILPSAPPFKKVIMYSPTYLGHADISFFPFGDFDCERLHKFLEEHEAMLLMRGHVGVRTEYGKFPSQRIIEFDAGVCPDVYDVLREVDVVITDYSSIYVDFLLLDRPVIFAANGLEEYKEKWGLMVDDYDFWTPGPKVSTFQEFLAALEDAFACPQRYSKTRRMINSLLNYHQDENSCAKTIEMIKCRLGFQKCHQV
jgi:CDP-glycerol glycerophosphotransferase (TagB/SpsB family)